MSNRDRQHELRERLAGVEREISELTCWGAAAAVLGEEQRSLKSEIAYVERKLATSEQ